jgi:hypothetical protein
MAKRKNDFDWWPNPRQDGDDFGQPVSRIWPKEVPVLSAENIRQDGMLGEDDWRCLLSWSAGFPSNRMYEIDTLLAEIIAERFGDGWSIEGFSDSAKRRDVADVWNEAMCRKNYDDVIS